MTKELFRDIADREEGDFNRQPFFDLADELEEADREKYATLIERCRSGAYDDFANEEFGAPKMQMVEDARAVGREDIAERAMNGDFDQ